jgi:hypothetical protein
MKTLSLTVYFLVILLTSCSQPNNDMPVQSPSTGASKNSDIVANADSDKILKKPNKDIHSSLPSKHPLFPKPTKVVTRSSVTVAEAAQLTPNQVQVLVAISHQYNLDRPFRIIVPTYIPDGFKVDDDISTTRDETGRWGGTPNAIDSYTLGYHNPDNSSGFSISASSGGWGDDVIYYEKVKVYSKALGIVVLSETASEHSQNSHSISFFGSRILRNGRGYDFHAQGISMKEAINIVESLQYMKSSQTKAAPLADIRRDADILVNKFSFPLDSCGDSPSKSSNRWYPVFMDAADSSSLYEHCKDAVVRESIGKNGSFAKLQVGSFTSYERALEFAKAVGGRVGKPDE